MIYSKKEQRFLELLVGNKSLSTFECQLKGFCTPNTTVHSLRSKGVEIKTTLRTTRGHSGDLHEGIAHYSLEGDSNE